MEMRQKSEHLTYKLKLHLHEGGGGRCHFYNLDLRLDPHMEQKTSLWTRAEFEMRTLHKDGIRQALCLEQEGKLEKQLTKGETGKPCVLAWALEMGESPLDNL